MWHWRSVYPVSAAGVRNSLDRDLENWPVPFLPEHGRVACHGRPEPKLVF